MPVLGHRGYSGNIALSGGWLSYHWENPATGQEEPKLGYVTKVDDTWFLGSGLYPEDGQ